MIGVVTGRDGLVRCDWGSAKPDYVDYHDAEWGVPVDDDDRLFEKLCLEGFQSGLSWYTILVRRDHFRRAFFDFDYSRVATMGPGDVERLLADPGIIRHRGKIESTINNARRSLDVVDRYGSLGAFFWSFEPHPTDRVVAAVTPESTALARELKKLGFSFVGPTTAYAFMQAMGIVNDHHQQCFAHPLVAAARDSFERPRPQASGDPVEL